MKPAKPFRFKQFIVEQDKCALKVNTDAVILGALVDFAHPRRILEVGTGTGVISLMLAQRFPEAQIQGIEIEEGAFLQTRQNFRNSPWAARLSAFHLPLQEFRTVEPFDLIVSNPPYFENHLKTSNLARNLALHSESLSFGELAKGVAAALAPDGIFWAILPERQMDDLTRQMAGVGLYPCAQVRVLDKPGAKTLRMVVGFVFTKDSRIHERELCIKDYLNQYSSEYADLLKEFLLIF